MTALIEKVHSARWSQDSAIQLRAVYNVVKFCNRGSFETKEELLRSLARSSFFDYLELVKENAVDDFKEHCESHFYNGPALTYYSRPTDVPWRSC